MTVDEDTPVKFPPCDVSEELQSLKLGKACSFSMALQTNVTDTFQEDRLFMPHNYLTTEYGFVASRHLGRKQRS
jgi:hypothetical protein